MHETEPEREWQASPEGDTNQDGNSNQDADSKRNSNSNRNSNTDWNTDSPVPAPFRSWPGSGGGLPGDEVRTARDH